MPDESRAYFLGAGASKADRFPLTTELRHGIAWAITEDPGRFRQLEAHLDYLYHVDAGMIADSARSWVALREGNPLAQNAGQRALPDVTDLLSAIDWMIQEQSSFGIGLEATTLPQRSGADLPQVRDQIVQALCLCLGTFRQLEAAVNARQFLSAIAPADSLMTTNWDLLLDAARHARFGSTPEDYGTTGHTCIEDASPPVTDTRPKLLKLHGSLSWRYCKRCQRLVIDPSHHVAGERTPGAKCACTWQYSELIVTPGFVREYRNVHLLTIWREALLTFVRSRQWIFVGYSLPPDDVAIRTLLLRARCIRTDAGYGSPDVTVVSGPNDRDATLARYRGLFPDARLEPGGFGEFIQRLGPDKA